MDLELIAETTCQICGVICTDAVCEGCGQTPANDKVVIYTGSTTETAPGQVRQHLSPQGLATIQLREPHRD